jgi:hypothetical protein
MHPLSRPAAALICAALLAPTASAAPPAKYPPKANTAHPQLILPNLSHDAFVPITASRGKKVLLIYFASWSEDSRRQLAEWHRITKPLIDAEKLVVIGVAQEQSPERCRLLLQWLKIDWSVLHDPLNTFEVRKIPLAIAIDEHGYVQDPNASPSTFEAKFVNQTYPTPKTPAYYERDFMQEPKVTRRIVGETNLPEDWDQHGTSSILSWRAAWLGEGVAAFTSLTSKQPKSAAAYFRLGVAQLFRGTSKFSEDDDLEAAVKSLKKALALSPRNAVYAQRLAEAMGKDKSSQAEWIKIAKKEIKARGDKPVDLPKAGKPAPTSAPAKKPRKKSAPKE